MKQKFPLLALTGLLAFWLAGCAGQPAKTPEQALAERAHAYWDAGKLRDAATIYRLESGSLDGKLTPDMVRIPASGAASLLSYEFKRIQIHDKEAEIEVDAQILLPALHKPYTDRRTDHWILIDGQWYHRAVASPLTQ